MAVAKNPKNGKWYAKFRYKDYAGKVIQKKKEGFETKKDAKAWEQEFIDRHEGKERLNFEQAYEKYLKDCEKRQKSTTIANKKGCKQYFVVFNKLPISEIGPQSIREWQNECLLALDDKGQMRFSKRTISFINAQLSTFFSWACKFCGLSRNPVTAAGAITIRSIAEKPTRVKNIWQREDFERFVSTVNREDYHLFFGVLFWLGLRRGEAMGLRSKDVNLSDKTVTICQNRTRLGMDTPKTKSSARTVSIPDHLVIEIKNYIKRLYKPTDKDLLFDSVRDSISNFFLNQQRKIGMEPIIRVHDLRHSHASLLINMGFSPDVVADRLGHANAAMVLKIYGHMYPQKRVEVTDALNKIYQAKDR